ncbi:hypothetical protein RintRC_2591 [Richelia intracellularis]|nr:hypothetical protein RintRC_2591 [Richelia intracellularis]
MARWTGLFPPGKGGGHGVAYGEKGKGILIHTLTEGSGMPLSNAITPANGSERDQMISLLDSVKVKTNKRGRPRKPLKVLAADKTYDSKDKGAALRRRGIRRQWPKRVGKQRRTRADPLKFPSHLTTRTFFPMVSKKISSSCLLSDGKEFQLVLMLFVSCNNPYLD